MKTFVRGNDAPIGYRAVKTEDRTGCIGCDFESEVPSVDVCIFRCCGEYRRDGVDVVFKKVDSDDC